jgi:hypothetical protein
VAEEDTAAPVVAGGVEGRLTVCHGISPGAGSGMRHSSVQRPGSCGGRAGLEPGEGRTLQRDELGDRATRPAAPDPV